MPMPPRDDAEEIRARLRRHLSVVCDESWPDEIRLAATRSIQASLWEDNPLRQVCASSRDGLRDHQKACLMCGEQGRR